VGEQCVVEESLEEINNGEQNTNVVLDLVGYDGKG